MVGVIALEVASELSSLASKLSTASSPPRVLWRERRACRVVLCFFPPLQAEVELFAMLSAHAHWERWSPQKPG